MAITEKQLFQALGLGAQEQEPAAPATQEPAVDPSTPAREEGQDGAQAQEPAAPAGAETDTAPETHTEPTAGNAENTEADRGEGAEKEALTSEQRKANAARRRQQEQQAAIDKAVADALEKERQQNAAMMESFFKQASIKDPYTGKAVENMEQFAQFQARYQVEQLKKGLQSGKLTQELLNSAIDKHPVVQQAKALVDQSADAAKKAQAEAMEVKVKAELEEIRKLDPTVQSMADLQKMPNFKEFYEFVKKGNNFLDAFRLANFDRLNAAAAEAARVQAASNARGKDHLQSTGNSRGCGAASVPADEMAMFRLLNPGASEAQIQAYYNKNKPR